LVFELVWTNILFCGPKIAPPMRFDYFYGRKNTGKPGKSAGKKQEGIL
jgi:hypothetical protein